MGIVSGEIHTEEASDLSILIPALAHKLNNRLTLVMGYAQLLLLQTEDVKTREELEKIVQEAQTASQISREIRSLVTQLQEVQTVDQRAESGWLFAPGTENR